MELLSVIVGAIIGAVPTLVGSFVLQERMWKQTRRKEAIDVVYGPLFAEVNRLQERAVRWDVLDFDEIVKIMEHYRYFLVDGKTRDSVNLIVSLARHYNQLRKACEGPANRIAREQVKRELQEETSDIKYRMFFEDQFIDIVSLEDAMIRGKTPKELLEERNPAINIKYVQFEALLEGRPVDIRLADMASETAVNNFKAENIFQRLRLTQLNILDHSDNVINQIRSKIA